MEKPRAGQSGDNNFISPAQQAAMTTETQTGVKEVARWR